MPMDRPHSAAQPSAAQPLTLIIEDEEVQRIMLERIVERAGWAFESYSNGLTARDRLLDQSQRVPDAVILDLGLPGMNGLDILKETRPQLSQLPVIIMTAQSSIRTVVDAMRAGASDFIIKPASAERIRSALEATRQTASFVGEIAGVSHDTDQGLDNLISASPATEAAKALAKKAARSTIPVLLEGESGVGKEVFARAVHASSARASQPFVAVNCGAIPENLVESILFGHEKGAFTGASEKRLGKFQEAAGGTLFLDEIGELPLDVQVKLLRALQEREIEPVGASKPVNVDIRIISATNRNLEEQVALGHFREDLFYRLNVFPIFLPPLRERPDDIPLLARHFLTQISAMEGLESKRMTPQLEKALFHYSWPGNVRQLQNALFRAAVLSETPELDLPHFKDILNAAPSASLPAQSAFLAHTNGLSALPQQPAPTSAFHGYRADTLSQSRAAAGPHDTHAAPSGLGISLQNSDGSFKTLAALEAEILQHALSHFGGHMSQVSRQLGIGRSTLYRKVSEYGLDAHGTAQHSNSDAASIPHAPLKKDAS